MFDVIEDSDEHTEDRVVHHDTETIVAKKDAPTSHYVDKAKLNDSLREWQRLKKDAIENGQEEPSLPDYAARSIIEIANNLSKKWNFRGYSFREEMVGDAILNVLKYIGNYNPNAETRSGEPNPFWYISRMCSNTFKFRIGTEDQQQYYKMAIVGNMTDDLLADDDFTNSLPNGSTSAREMFQDMQAKAATFEKKRADKKIAKKKAAQDLIDEMIQSDAEVTEEPEATKFSLLSIFV